MLDPIIRPARLDDVPALASLANRTFCETFVDGFKMNYPPDDLRAFLSASYNLPSVASWITDPRGEVLVAEGRGELLAYVQCGDNSLPYPEADPQSGELKRIYVLSTAQGMGLGRALLERSLATLSGRPVLIGVWSGNHKALRLYGRYGFTPVGAYQFPVGSVLDDELILGRPAH